MSTPHTLLDLMAMADDILAAADTLGLEESARLVGGITTLLKQRRLTWIERTIVRWDYARRALERGGTYQDASQDIEKSQLRIGRSVSAIRASYEYVNKRLPEEQQRRGRRGSPPKPPV